MARAASVPGLWTLGFLLLRGTCVWVWVVVRLGFRLRPATPGWGVGVCVCFGPVPLVPRHSWLGCAVWVCVLGLGFQLRPATPGWGVGICVCLCARSARTLPLLPGVCGVGVFVWARVSAAPRHSWVGWWGVCVLVCVLPLYPATPGWGVWCGCLCLGWGFGCAPPLLAGVLGCACLCACSPCTPPLLAGVCGVGVCAWGRVSLRPVTPGWGVGGCVCSCARSACTPPLLAGVCGVGVGFRARVSAAPCHSWLGCAAWVCVFGLGFRLRPTTTGSVVRVCVCWSVCSSCTPPVLAAVCGVGVGIWARVLASPRHSWLGCWGVCVLVCALRLCPATPGRGVRCRCVCFGSGFGCAPPLVAGVLGCACLCVCSPCTPPLLAGAPGAGVCVWVRVSAAPPHCWLGCWGVCVLVWALPLYPATAGWGARVGVRVWVRVPAAPRHSWLGCWVVCALVWALPLYPATPGWGARRGCVCLGSGLGCAPPLLAWVLGCVCAGVDARLVPRHSWLWRAAWVCVFGLGFRLRPATPGWGVGVCLCWCARSACAPPLLAGVWGVGVCVWAQVSAAPRHSWLGCWGVRVCVRAPLVPHHSWLRRAAWVCVFGFAFRLRPATPGWGVGVCVCWCGRSPCTPPLLAGVCGVGVCVLARVSAPPRHSWLRCWGVCFFCVPPLYPATPGSGVRRGCVCLDSGFGCAPPLLAWVSGFVCAGVRALPVPCRSWLGCAVWVCVFELGFLLRPATPVSGVGVCVCLCACCACTPPLLAGGCGVGVCACARLWAALRHSWLGCWGVCVLLFALGLYPATPGWGVRRGCVCSGSGFSCAPPLLAGVPGCVCTGVRAPPVPCHSWLGCALWVCVLGLRFWLRPATPGWGVWCVG